MSGSEACGYHAGMVPWLTIRKVALSDVSAPPLPAAGPAMHTTAAGDTSFLASWWRS